MKKVLITGITGFAGSFLAEHLTSLNDHEVYGTYLSDKSIENIEDIKDSLRLTKIDLTDAGLVDNLITQINPDEIYHLAALPSPSDSHQNPAEYIHNNVDVQLNILESLKKHSQTHTRMLVISSAEIYGSVPANNLPISESAELRPNSPYSVSKATQDLLGLQYYLSYDLPVIRVRPFNHIGPRQSPSFVVAAFAQQVAKIEKGLQEPKILVGNLDAKRDFTDVRDMVKAYQIVMGEGQPGEVYNIGSGKSHSISEVLEIIISLSKTPMEIVQDPSRKRPSDVPDLVCDTSRIGALGWKSTVPLKETLLNTLDYWRAIV